MFLCLLVGIVPAYTVAPLLAVAATSTLGGGLPEYSLAIWHGFNLPLAMSAAGVLGGVVLYFGLRRLIDLYAVRNTTPGRDAFHLQLDLLSALAQKLTGAIANGSLQRMLLGLVVVAVVAAAAPWLAAPAWPNWPSPQPMPLLGWATVSAGGYPVQMVGTLALPALVPHDPTLYAWLRGAHGVLGVARLGRGHALHAFHRLAPAGGLAHQAAIAHHEAAAHQGVDGRAMHGAAVPWRDLADRLQAPLRQHRAAVHVHHGDVGVRAHGQHALGAVQAPGLGGRRRAPLHVVHQGGALAVHFREHQRHLCFHARKAAIALPDALAGWLESCNAVRCYYQW